jgi:predicted ATPase/DNA-binding CsgD family transcriptional regulator
VVERVKIGTLPYDLTSFVGRRREVASIKRRLTGSQLVTLTGVGGTGKTRLALRVATDLRRAFRNGVWFIDLTQIHGSGLLTTDANDPGAPAYLVAAALGLRLQSAGSPLRQLADQLAHWDALLVLDNCEHLIPAAATLADMLLRNCPGLRLVATSREQLSLAKEVTYAVPPLPTPDPRQRLDVTQLSRCESVSLFLARAQAARPGFRLTPQNYSAVTDVCCRVDGLPLAIELAAARIRVLTPQQIVERLDKRFVLLNGGPRSAPQRQQTLRDCVDWSFELCSDPEQRLWTRLSVFSGGFQLPAVNGICADETLPEADLPDLIAGLVEKSILIRDDQNQPARYRLLDTIREYGQEQLAQSGAEAALRRRHANWHLYLAEEAEREWFGPEQATWCQRLRHEHANLGIALDFYLSGPEDRQRGLRLAAAMWFYWLVFGLVLEGRNWLRRALEAHSEPTRDRAKALWADGHLASVQGELDASTHLLQTAHDLAKELSDELTQARAIKRLGAVAMHSGDLERANGLLVDALARLEALDDAEASAVHARVALAMTHYLRGDFAAAAAQGQQVMAICRPRGDKYLLAYALNNLARVEISLGQLESASAYALEALTLRRSLPDALTLIFSLDLLTQIAAAAGDYARAATFIGASRPRWQAFGPSVRHWKVLAEPHGEWEERTQRALGEAAFASAVRRGAEFTLDEIISLALGKDVEPSPLDEMDQPDMPLTPREAQIAELVSQGMSNKQLAAELVLSRRTVEGHVEKILQKMGFTRRTQIASWIHDH